MEKFRTINQYAKIYSDPPERIRNSSRGIVMENGRILLTYEANTGTYMSPGGGVEDNETLEECCIRELKEESGYIVKPYRRLLTINEYSFETLYISNYFLCEIQGKCEQQLTETEVYNGVGPRWVDIDKAIEIFSTYPSKPQDKSSLYLREYTVLNYILNEKKPSAEN